MAVIYGQAAMNAEERQSGAMHQKHAQAQALTAQQMFSFLLHRSANLPEAYVIRMNTVLAHLFIALWI